MSDPFLIPIILPNKNLNDGAVPLLGHGGFIMVDADGKATYLDYGRYNEQNSNSVLTSNPDIDEGNIRQLEMRTPLKFDSSGNVTSASLKSALDEVFGSTGPFGKDIADSGLASVTQFKMGKDQFTNLTAWKDKEIVRIEAGTTKYDLTNHNCINFLYDAAKAAGVKISGTGDPLGTAVPSIEAGRILEAAKTGFQYFGPDSNEGNKLLTDNNDIYSAQAAIRDLSGKPPERYGATLRMFSPVSPILEGFMPLILLRSCRPLWRSRTKADASFSRLRLPAMVYSRV